MGKKYTKKIVIVGAGVADINAATKLVDNGYPGELITIIDKGQDPYNRKPEQVMEGMLGAGGWSDGKLTYHTSIGGVLSKYTGEEKAYNLFDQVIENFKRFHPNPSVIMKSDPQEEPEFIKPYFGLRLFPVYHIGSDFLHEIGKRWYDYLLSKKVNFEWQSEVIEINFKDNEIIYLDKDKEKSQEIYETLIFGAGKSGIDFSQKLIKKYELETEAKSVQIGVRYEAPMKYFQKLIDISYDFKLYQKPTDKVSLRSFCTNNEAAYVAVEETYGDISYNGHALKDPKYKNDMTNFGILMEIKGIENPFEWARQVVEFAQTYTLKDENAEKHEDRYTNIGGAYYSPKKTRKPTPTSEGTEVKVWQVSDRWFEEELPEIFNLDNAKYIINFINDLDKVFNIGDDWGIYIPEVKYVSPEPIVNYSDLSLKSYPNIHFVGDALSARGITVSGAQGIYVAESILK